MRATLRLHPKMDKFIGQPEVQNAIDQLIRGAPIDSVPISIKHQVLTGLNSRRKDAILRHNDALANKIDVIIGEFTRGPDKYVFDGPTDPNKTLKARALESKETERMKATTTKLLNGESRIDDIDSHSRQSVAPFLKNDRVLEISRANYGQGRNIDKQIENCHEYSIDSRRLGPKLQRVAEIEKKLAAAKKRYEETRTSCYQRRREYTDLEKVAAVELEKKLQGELVEYGSHIPTKLPLEYQKFSSKVLNARQKEQMGAKLGMYDDALANRKIAIQLEREELTKNNEIFGKAFLKNREVMLKSQQQKREGFREIWRRKKDKITADLAAEMEQAKKSVENLEKELEDAKSVVYSEVGRIRSGSSMKNQGKIPSSLESFK